MNKRIKNLTEQLERTISLQKETAQELRTKLQAEYNKVFDDSAKLAKVCADAQSASKYQTNEWGEIESWYRFADLSDYAECREYDKRAEQEVREQLESGNEWAWCSVEITARFKGFKGTDCLGSCSYKSQEDFISNSGGYYEDMRNTAFENLVLAMLDARASIFQAGL